MIVRTAKVISSDFGAPSSCRVSLVTIHRLTVSTSPWAVCTRASPMAGSCALWVALFYLGEAPAARTLFVFCQQSVFCSGQNWPWVGVWVKQHTQELQRAKMRHWSCSQGPLGWSHPIIVPPGSSSAAPSSKSKVTQQSHSLKISACLPAGFSIEGMTSLLPEGLCLQRQARRVLYRFMTCLSQYLFYTVTWTNHI